MKTLLSTTALLLTLSFSGTALANSEWYGKEGQDMSPSYMEKAICKLPKEDAAQFRDTMKEARENNKDLQEQIGKLHGDLHDILTAETFDKAAFLAKRKDLQQLHDKMETNMTEAFASAVGDLTQDERVTLTRSMDRSRAKHHGHDKHRHVNKQISDTYPAQPKAPIADTAPVNAVKK